jgi:hypothetical protein
MAESIGQHFGEGITGPETKEEKKVVTASGEAVDASRIIARLLRIRHSRSIVFRHSYLQRLTTIRRSNVWHKI